MAMRWSDLDSLKVAAHGQLILGIDPVPDHTPLALCSGASPLEAYKALVRDRIDAYAAATSQVNETQ